MDIFKRIRSSINRNKSKRYNLVFGSHQYPYWLLRHPWLMLLYYFASYLFYPRNFFFAFHLYNAIKNNPNASVLEVGFGEGIHLIPFALLFPKVKFFGFDIREENTRFILCLSDFLKVKNVVIYTDQTNFQISLQKFDFLYMVGVLQYVKNDNKFLSHLKEKLKKSGSFLLYQPVNYVRYLTMLDKRIEKFNHYEKEANLQRKYNEESLKKLLSDTGFIIRKMNRFMFKSASITQEVFRYFYVPLVKSSNLIEKIIGLIGLIIFSPLIILLSQFGNILKSRKSNAILIICSNQTFSND